MFDHGCYCDMLLAVAQPKMNHPALTLCIKYLLLCRLLSINAVELEAILFGEVLRVGDLNNGWFRVWSILTLNNNIFLIL
jgi:hypothetical protein